MSEETPHDPQSEDCRCFRCKLGSVQLKRSPQTNHKFRPMEQPNDPPVVQNRPGGFQVGPYTADGKRVRASDLPKYGRQLAELERRSHQQRQEAHDAAAKNGG